MSARLIAAGLSIAAMAWAGSGEAAQVPAPRSAPSAAQFYVLSFTDAPIAEVAEAVVGGALSRDLSIDPAVEGTMSFTVEGAFTPEALLQEFGTAALDQDLALMASRAGDLALVPRANMAMEMTRGATLVALPVIGAAAPVKANATAAAPIVYGRDRWWDGPVGGLLIFLTGAVSGAGALLAGQRILRPVGPIPPTMIRITHTPVAPVEPTATWADDPELTIPQFETRSRKD
jgi:hypothetical protein